MSGSEREMVPAQRQRRYPPRQYPEQLIMMSTGEMARFVRSYAQWTGRSQGAVLREWTQAGIDAVDPATRALVETLTEDDGPSNDLP